MALRMSNDFKKNNEEKKVSDNVSRVRISDSLKGSSVSREIGNSYFSKPGDLDVSMGVTNEKKSTRDEIESYLSLVVSGERYGFQKGLPYSGGVKWVSYEELREMVDKGDNIIKAECLDDNGVLISIEYESYGNIENNKQGRGR